MLSEAMMTYTPSAGISNDMGLTACCPVLPSNLTLVLLGQVRRKACRGRRKRVSTSKIWRGFLITAPSITRLTFNLRARSCTLHILL